MRFFAATTCLLAAGIVCSIDAQAARTFKARLTPVPIDVAMQSTVAGSGTVSAVLTGRVLTVTGSFEGLRSPATTAQVHLGRKGVRGPAILDLVVSNAARGVITGTLQLTAPQVDALDKEALYIQLQSEKAPDGNLWGWLVKPEVKR